MLDGFARGIAARLLRLVALFFFGVWVISGFSWFWALVTFGILVWSSYLRYQSQHTVRIRE